MAWPFFFPVCKHFYTREAGEFRRLKNFFCRENRNGGIKQKMKQRGERSCLFPESMAAAGNTNKLKKLCKPSLPGPSKGNWDAANPPAYPTSSTSSAPKPPALSFDPAPVPRLAAPGRAL